MGAPLTYAEVEEKSRRFGAWLQKVAGLRKGDRVALMMPNVLQYPVAIVGAHRAGCTVVNVNPLYTARELEHQLNDSGATVIVIFENAAATLAAGARAHRAAPRRGDRHRRRARLSRRARSRTS